ncbi:MAG TPA: thiamine-phosphate kinase, partial [Vulgatibacter sp.]
GGEDYELLFAVPPSKAAAFRRAAERAGDPITRIGRVVRGSAIRVFGEGGEELPLPPRRGWDHWSDGR